MNPTSVHDSGNLHKYRTEIPNLVLEMLAQGKLSRHAVTLYLVLKRTAGDDGVCWKSSQRLQDECRIGAGLLVNAKKELAEAGLIKITETARPTGRAFHRITITDIWPENMAYFSQNPQSDACSDTEQASSDTEHRSSNMEHPCSDMEPKKNTNKNNQNKKTPPAPAGAAKPDKREDQRMFDCLCAVYGQAPSSMTQKTRGRFNRQIKGWREQGITADQIAAAVDLYRSENPKDTTYTYLSIARLDEYIGKARTAKASQPAPIPPSLRRFFTDDGRLKAIGAVVYEFGLEGVDQADPSTWPDDYMQARAAYAEARRG